MHTEKYLFIIRAWEKGWLGQLLVLTMCMKHYQKIDKYKRKYRGNIFVGKFPRDFTDGNIPSVYTDGITVWKKFKTKQKKKMTCHFY
jgi:hypothetical protein